MQREEAHAGARRLHLMLTPDVHAPAAARRALRTLPLGDAEIDVVLLTSELVADAVVHAVHADGEGIELSAACENGWARVEVRDHGHGFADGELAGGHGIQALAAASARWGIEHDGTSRVWFEVDR
jgi:anti-sigma regulatory factor (Ser/Thr protein kinase)